MRALHHHNEERLQVKFVEPGQALEFGKGNRGEEGGKLFDLAEQRRLLDVLDIHGIVAFLFQALDKGLLLLEEGERAEVAADERQVIERLGQRVVLCNVEHHLAEDKAGGEQWVVEEVRELARLFQDGVDLLLLRLGGRLAWGRERVHCNRAANDLRRQSPELLLALAGGPQGVPCLDQTVLLQQGVSVEQVVICRQEDPRDLRLEVDQRLRGEVEVFAGEGLDALDDLERLLPELELNSDAELQEAQHRKALAHGGRVLVFRALRVQVKVQLEHVREVVEVGLAVVLDKVCHGLLHGEAVHVDELGVRPRDVEHGSEVVRELFLGHLLVHAVRGILLHAAVSKRLFLSCADEVLQPVVHEGLVGVADGQLPQLVHRRADYRRLVQVEGEVDEQFDDRVVRLGHAVNGALEEALQFGEGAGLVAELDAL